MLVRWRRRVKQALVLFFAGILVGGLMGLSGVGLWQVAEKIGDKDKSVGYFEFWEMEKGK